MNDEYLSYRNPEKIEYKNWYGIASVSSEEDKSYCEFCFDMFKTYHELLHGVCVSCGKADPSLKKNKQQTSVLTAVNSRIPGDSIQGVSLEIDTDKTILTDETTNGYLGDKVHMSANSIGEAVRKLRDAERSNTVITSGNIYELKTTYKDKETELESDTDRKSY